MPSPARSTGTTVTREGGMRTPAARSRGVSTSHGSVSSVRVAS